MLDVEAHFSSLRDSNIPLIGENITYFKEIQIRMNTSNWKEEKTHVIKHRQGKKSNNKIFQKKNRYKYYFNEKMYILKLVRSEVWAIKKVEK